MNHKTIKTVLIIAALVMGIALRSQGQTIVTQKGNVLTSVNKTVVSSDTSITKNSVLTEFTFTISSGEVLNVWKSVPGGRYYVVRKAKSSGNVYRQYLTIE